MDKFNALNTFLAVANTTSFAKASQAMGTSPSTISKAIDRLEKELGFRLFQRTTRTLKLTEQGILYREKVSHIFEELTLFEETLVKDNRQPKGNLKINAPVSYGRLYILPLLPKFKKKYPEIKLEIRLDDAYLDMIENGYDISIRSGTLQDSRLVAQQLSSIDVITVANVKSAKLLKSPLSDKDISKNKWIQFRFKQSGKVAPIQTLNKGNIISHSTEPELIVDDGEALVELCISGMGFIQLPHFLLRDALKAGKVVPIMKSFTSSHSGIYAIYAKREYLPNRVRVFIDYLKEELERNNEKPNGTWALKLKTLQKPNFKSL